MASRSNPKYLRAYEQILSALERGEFRNSRFVPPITVIAEATGVSRFTVWRVMQQLREEGRIEGRSGCRNSLPEGDDKLASTAAAPDEGLRRAKHRDLEARIRADIVNAKYQPGSPLPSAKILAETYGVSQRTLRKALAGLTTKSLLVHRSTHFHVRSVVPSVAPAGSRIVLIGHGQNLGFNVLWGYWHRECVKHLEFECRRSTIGLDLVCFTNDESGLTLINGRTGKPCQLDKDSSTLGFVYLVTGPASADDELLQRLTEWKIPISIIDENGLWPSISYLKTHPVIRVFRNTVSPVAAQRVARFVLELGHRKAVFISPFHKATYSQERLATLRNEFGFAKDGALAAVTDSYDLAKFDQYAARINMDGIIGQYREWKKDLPYAYTSLMDDHFNMLYAKMLEGRQREYLDDLFARALDMKDATVWILVNDLCASYAIDFLSHRGISIPRDLSVISFDDLPVALEKGITSYNFNYPAMMKAALRYIADAGQFTSRRPIVTIEGEVIPRGTTARLRMKPTCR